MYKVTIPLKYPDSESERRAERRLWCSNLVKLSWLGMDGIRRSEIGLLEDVSSKGFGVSMDIAAPLVAGTELSVLANRERFTGRVTQCTSRADGYFVGLELDTPCEQVDGMEQVLDVTLLDLG